MARTGPGGVLSRRSRVERLVHDLRRASFAMQAHVRAALARQGLSLGQFVVLRGLVAAGTGTTRDLARSMGVTTGNITGLVDKLEAEGLVVRERSTQDRRVVYLRPTPKGSRVVAGLREAVTTEVAKAFDAWSVADLERLDALLRRIGPDRAAPC